MNYLKTLGVAAATTAAGLALLGVGSCIGRYTAASGKVGTAPLVQYRVPDDGSVSLMDCARAEGMTGLPELKAYEDAAGKNLLGGEWEGGDGSGGDFWNPRTWEIMRGYEWEGGLPKGWDVRLPDVNGDGYVGPARGLQRYLESKQQQLREKAKPPMEPKGAPKKTNPFWDRNRTIYVMDNAPRTWDHGAHAMV